MGTAVKPRGWDGEKSRSEACRAAPGSGWVLQTLDLLPSGPCPSGTGLSRWPTGSCFSERRLGRAAHGKEPDGTQLLAAAEEESDSLHRYQRACWPRFFLWNETVSVKDVLCACVLMSFTDE